MSSGIQSTEDPTRRADDDSDPNFVPAFDPRVDISADAKYIVKNLVLWFFVAPILLGVLAAVIVNAFR
jgi:hypothetical protein